MLLSLAALASQAGLLGKPSGEPVVVGGALLAKAGNHNYKTLMKVPARNQSPLRMVMMKKPTRM